LVELKVGYWAGATVGKRVYYSVDWKADCWVDEMAVWRVCYLVDQKAGYSAVKLVGKRAGWLVVERVVW
jgi:hypothetical protein